MQPFLYIEKVNKKRTVDYANQHRGKEKPMKFPRMTGKIGFPPKSETGIPDGYSNLYEFEDDKKTTANKVFGKMNEFDVGNVKDSFAAWNAAYLR